MTVLKIFLVLLTSKVALKHKKCVSWSNQKCTTKPALCNLYLNQYTQGLCLYPFSVNLDRCVGNCNTHNDLSNKVCVSSKTEDLNLSMFNMITEINESKTRTKHISWECKYKFDCRKFNSNQNWNSDKCLCKSKHPKKHVCEKDYILNPATCDSKNGKHLAIIIDDSVIRCDEIIEMTNSPFY